jgi:hypothetical protein
MRLALTLALSAALTFPLNADAATPTSAPNARAKWYIATVAGEHYGPFRSVKTASAFCASVPVPCKVEPVMPPAEWTRKGAR